MSEFGWTRLAYLTVVLSVIALLVKLGTLGAGSIPEDFPQAALAFAQREPAAEEDLDWESRENRPDERSLARSEARSEVTTVSRDEERDPSREPVASLYENVDFREDAPVFYRPAPRVSGASRNPSSTGAAGAKSCQTLADAPSGSKILFPLGREYFDSYEDTWGAARPQGGHEGADMMAPMGTPEYAITDGTVVPVSGSNSNGWNTLGGYAVMIEAAYSVGPVRKGDLFYYAHMDRKSDLQIGDTVKAGDVVGYAGDTGEGPEGTRGLFPSHLHLGWYETGRERTQLASGAMNPYPLLEWVKANGGSIAGGSDVPYCEAPQSSAPTPSDGGYWQFPSDPGVRPDMSTETDTAAPSPVVEPNASAESSPDVTREPRRPVRPDEPANSAPPQEPDEPTEPATPRPPPDEAPPFPNLPDIGDIGDWVGGLLPGTPEPPPEDDETGEPAEPTAPPAPKPPREGTDAEDPELTAPEETTPEETTPEEDPECKPRGELREHVGEEKPREGSRPDEDCHEETAPSEEPPPDDTSGETTGIEKTTPGEAVEDPAAPPVEQYEPEEPEVQAEFPERPGASPGS